MSTLDAQIAAVRDLLDKADRYPHADPRQIGNIILALEHLVSIVELLDVRQSELAAQQERHIHEYDHFPRRR